MLLLAGRVPDGQFVQLGGVSHFAAWKLVTLDSHGLLETGCIQSGLLLLVELVLAKPDGN